ncbi:hypothetical protein MDOR_15390 [Mycolicibacterium doricum]|uniref:Uncharacterized protein n=1 Tax=Mycolicibacterium doricum TaxID=126673 RepID=A0A7I7VQR6_9MYCO|nr:hypothetical protein MDOR_15390 [Mycolicibacterium doricum]
MTTFDEKKLSAVPISWFSIVGRTSGPNSGAMWARLPSMPNSRGGSDNAHQNAALADSENIESSQLFDNVRITTARTWCREGSTGDRWAVMTRPALLTTGVTAQKGYCRGGTPWW